MSSSTTSKAGPIIGTKVREAHGVFTSDAALQDAIARLTQAGFDRADLSLPTTGLPLAQQTPEQGAETPNTDDDRQQIRTLQTSLAGSVGAIAAAGAVIATGGAALPAVVAAAAVGIGAGGLANAASTAGSEVVTEGRAEAAARGQLVLSVRITEPAEEERAQRELQAAGAIKVTVLTA